MEKIVLFQHNPTWRQKFEYEAEMLGWRLSDSITNIHHVGSTAVPDLMAKPIIDIAVESNVYPPTTDILSIMADLGYECQGESGVQGRIWFTKGEPREFNLHFCPVDSDIVIRQIKFRDALKKDIKLRRRYETLKLNNSMGRNIDDAQYAGSKSKLIEAVLNP